MNCINCGSTTNLVGSCGIGVSVRRYRRCPKCDAKMTTYEVPEQMLKKALEFLDMEEFG
jgi:transcriptional regulator NrdR family protein